jgi:hypothetical protein
MISELQKDIREADELKEKAEQDFEFYSLRVFFFFL